MRLVFFGSGGFGVLTLRALVIGDHEIAGVVTRADKPAGRGRGLSATPIKIEAEKHGLPLLETANPNDGALAAKLRELRPDVGVVVAYGHLLGEELLSIPRYGFLNLHASLLPAWRGAAPVPHAILAGDAKTGVTVFRLSPRFDDGDILLTEDTPIRPDDTSETLLARLAMFGARAMMNALGQLEAGWGGFHPQNHAVASRAPKLHKEDGRIDWSKSVYRLEREVRAYQPWPQSSMVVPTHRGLVRMTVLAMETIPDVADVPPPWESGRLPRALEMAACDDVPPGTILWADDRHGLLVRCLDGMVRITRLKPQGRTAMTGQEFIRGTRVVLGARLL